MSSIDDELEKRRLHEEIVKLKLAKLEALEREIALRERLPHRYGMKFFPWQKEWFDCRARVQCVTAANQIGKSLTMARKVIEWATNEELWPELWPELHKNNRKPTTMWYLYPTRDMSISEFHDKWRPILPPQDDPEYGWEYSKRDKLPPSLHFIHKGVTIYFKTYAQGAELLQAGSCAVVACDEEIDEALVPELQSRVSATQGYMIFGFTATTGQLFWKKIVEDRTVWPNAWVRQISLFDCMKYTDGTTTMWSKERIKERIDQCTTNAEVQRRIYGKFVKDDGLRFPQFDRDKHLAGYHHIPRNWEVYSGIDFGSGGDKGHPSTIVFVAVNPDYTQARAIRMWRGDKRVTTAEDVIDKWVEMKNTVVNDITATYYDFSATDLGTLAARRGLPFLRADKSRDAGNSIVSSLLKTGILKFYVPSELSEKDGVPDQFLEGYKIAQEFESLSFNAVKSTSSAYCPDDLIDALRYACIKIPFNMRSGNNGDYLIVSADQAKKAATYYSAFEARTNRDALKMWKNNDSLDEIEGEFEFWNGMLGD